MSMLHPRTVGLLRRGGLRVARVRALFKVLGCEGLGLCGFVVLGFGDLDLGALGSVCSFGAFRRRA